MGGKGGRVKEGDERSEERGKKRKNKKGEENQLLLTLQQFYIAPAVYVILQ